MSITRDHTFAQQGRRIHAFGQRFAVPALAFVVLAVGIIDLASAHRRSETGRNDVGQSRGAGAPKAFEVAATPKERLAVLRSMTAQGRAMRVVAPPDVTAR